MSRTARQHQARFAEPSPFSPLQLGEDTARLTAPGLVDIAAFLRSCQHPDGGFGGGPGQIAHTATTYASVAALATLGPKAVGHLDRASLRRFLERMCVPRDRGGGMTVHDGGEVDIRACYTAVASGVLAGIDVAFMEERAGIGEYIARCQTAEGGIGGEPGNEAHGGYTYCGLACAALLGTAQMLDLRRLAHWCAWQQAAVEGGLRGRTNKLADGCYTFWQGSIPALLRRVGADIMRQSPVPRAPGAAGGGGAAEAWRAAECALRDVHVGEVGLDQQAETHLMGIGERGGAQAVERAKRDVSRCDVNAAELFAECAARCSAGTRDTPFFPPSLLVHLLSRHLLWGCASANTCPCTVPLIWRAQGRPAITPQSCPADAPLAGARAKRSSMRRRCKGGSWCAVRWRTEACGTSRGREGTFITRATACPD